jgi:hypothetical protein
VSENFSLQAKEAVKSCASQRFSSHFLAEGFTAACRRKKTLLGEVVWEKGSTKTGTRTQDQLVKSQLLYQLSYLRVGHANFNWRGGKICGLSESKQARFGENIWLTKGVYVYWTLSK